MSTPKKIHIHPKRLARSVARAKLEAAGVTGYNKQNGVDLYGRKIPSAFSRNWKKIVTEAVKVPPKKRKEKK